MVGTKSLKSTQAYPPGYGAEVAGLWEEGDKHNVIDVDSTDVSPINIATGLLALKSIPWDVEAWDDLDCQHVLVVLRGAGLLQRCPLQGRVLLG